MEVEIKLDSFDVIAAIPVLVQYINEGIKHGNISEDTLAKLTRVVEALQDADRIVITDD